MDAARLAQANSKKRGEALVNAVTEAVELACRQGRPSPFHRLVPTHLWTWNGLSAPQR